MLTLKHNLLTIIIIFFSVLILQADGGLPIPTYNDPPPIYPNTVLLRCEVLLREIAKFDNDLEGDVTKNVTANLNAALGGTRIVEIINDLRYNYGTDLSIGEIAKRITEMYKTSNRFKIIERNQRQQQHEQEQEQEQGEGEGEEENSPFDEFCDYLCKYCVSMFRVGLIITHG